MSNLANIINNNEEIILNDETVSFYKDLRQKREATWFTTFVKNTDEKVKTSDIMQKLISIAFKNNDECNILDIGCGEGFLSAKIAQSMKLSCTKVKYSAIDKDKDLAFETKSKLSYVGIEENNIVVGDCYGDGLSIFNQAPLLLVASHVAYWAPDIREFIEKIIEKMGDDTIAVFIHQSPYSLVSQLRAKYALDLKVNSPNEIAKLLFEKGMSFTELLFSSTVTYPEEASTQLLVDSDKFTANELYYTARNLTEFILQSPLEYLDRMGTKEEILKQIDLKLKSQDNKVILWEIMQIASKKSQKIEEIKNYLINYKDELGLSALHWAIFEKREEIVKYLLLNGCDVNAIGPYNITPLELAVIRGDSKVITNLISNGAFLSETRLDLSHLIFAIYSKNNELIELLMLSSSIQAQLKDKFFVTFTDEFKFVADKANYLNGNENGPTAIVGQYFSVKLIILEDLIKERELLSELVIDSKKTVMKAPNLIVDPNGNKIKTSLDFFQEGDSLLHHYMNSDFDSNKVESLLKSGFDVNSKNHHGITPLSMAILKNSYVKARLLLEYGADPNITDLHLQNSLAHAVSKCDKQLNLDIVMLLLNYSVNINQVNDNGYTPIVHASRSGCFDYVLPLVEHGATISNIINGNNILHFTNGSKLVEFYLNKELNIDIDAIQVNNDANFTPLLIALTGFHDQKSAELFIRKGAKLDVPGEPISALQSAVQQNMTNIVGLALQYGANVNSAINNGVTPLHEAAGLGNIPIIKCLLSYGANLNAKTIDGNKPKDIAIINQQPEALQILIQAEENPELVKNYYCEKETINDQEFNDEGYLGNISDNFAIIGGMLLVGTCMLAHKYINHEHKYIIHEHID